MNNNQEIIKGLGAFARPFELQGNVVRSLLSTGWSTKVFRDEIEAREYFEAYTTPIIEVRS